MATEPTFESIGPPFSIKGRGQVIPVRNPGGYPEPNVLTGQHVVIDGERWLVRGVESFAIARPYPDHLDFAFLVAEDDG